MDDIGAHFQYINSLPDVACFTIERQDTKTVEIYHTLKLKEKLGFISAKVCAGTTVRFFEVVEPPVYKLLLCEQIRMGYINKGWAITNQSFPFVKYKAYSRIDMEGRHFLVYIVSARGDKTIVGVFKSVSEADLFMDEYYPEGIVQNVVYAANEETGVYKRKYEWREKQFYVESSEQSE